MKKLLLFSLIALLLQSCSLGFYLTDDEMKELANSDVFVKRSTKHPNTAIVSVKDPYPEDSIFLGDYYLQTMCDNTVVKTDLLDLTGNVDWVHYYWDDLDKMNGEVTLLLIKHQKVSEHGGIKADTISPSLMVAK